MSTNIYKYLVNTSRVIDDDYIKKAHLQKVKGSGCTNPIGGMNKTDEKETSANPAADAKHGLSEEFRRRLAEYERNTQKDNDIKGFQKAYEKSAKEIITKQLSQIIKQPTPVRHDDSSDILELLSDVLRGSVGDVYNADAFAESCKLAEHFEYFYKSGDLAHNVGGAVSSHGSSVQTGQSVYIYDTNDLNRVPPEALSRMAQLLEGKYLDSAAAIRVLEKFIPRCRVEVSQPQSLTNNCVSCGTRFDAAQKPVACRGNCGRQICPQCVGSRRKLTRFGYNRPVNLCVQCTNTLRAHDAQLWAEMATSLIGEHHRNLNAVAFCFAVSTRLQLAEPEFLGNSTLQIFQNLQNRCIALAFALQVLHCSADSKSKSFHAKILIADVLVEMAKDSCDEREKREFCEQSRRILTDAKSTMLPCELKVTSSISKQLEMIRLYVESVQSRIPENVGLTAEVHDQLKMHIEAGDLESTNEYLYNEEEQTLKAAISLLISTHYEPRNPRNVSLLHFVKGVYYIRYFCHNNKAVVLGHEHLRKACWGGWITYHNMASVVVQFLTGILNRTRFSLLHAFSSQPTAVLLQRLDTKEGDGEMQRPDGCDSMALRKYEDDMLKNFAKRRTWDALDVAFGYVDMIDVCSNLSERAMACICAAEWMLKAIGSTQVPSKRHACMKIVYQFVYMAMTIAYSRLSVSMKYYCAQVCHRICVDSGKQGGASEKEAKLCCLLLKNSIFFAQFCPLWNPQSIRVSDAAVLTAIYDKLHSEFMEQMNGVDIDKQPIRDALISYAPFADDLQGFTPNKHKDRNTLRCDAMLGFMAEHDMTFDDVERSMTCPLFERDDNGWYCRKASLAEMQVDNGFSEIHGLKINKQTGEVNILVDPPGSGLHPVKSNVVWWDDVKEMLMEKQDMPERGMLFSLDHPDGKLNNHPFQQFRFAPQSLMGGLILDTLYHTDYLLKQFTVGVEISSKPPFAQRPCSKNGIYKGLPTWLISVLRPITERIDKGNSVEGSGRFWIHADDIETDIEQTQSEFIIYVGHVNMSVKYHSQIPDIDGNQVDTLLDNDEETPENSFCKDFTENYDNISNYFPEFRRLRELSKLDLLLTYLFAPEKSLIDLEKPWNLQAIRTKQLEDSLDRFRAALSSLDSHGSQRTKRPTWVPAAICREQGGSRVYIGYGGVDLSPKVKPTPLSHRPKQTHSQQINECVLRDKTNVVKRVPTVECQQRQSVPNPMTKTMGQNAGKQFCGDIWKQKRTQLSDNFQRRNYSYSAKSCSDVDVLTDMFKRMNPRLRGQEIHKMHETFNNRDGIHFSSEREMQSVWDSIDEVLVETLGTDYKGTCEVRLPSKRRADAVFWSADGKKCVIMELKTVDSKVVGYKKTVEKRGETQVLGYCGEQQAQHAGVELIAMVVIVGPDSGGQDQESGDKCKNINVDIQFGAYDP